MGLHFGKALPKAGKMGEFRSKGPWQDVQIRPGHDTVNQTHEIAWAQLLGQCIANELKGCLVKLVPPKVICQLAIELLFFGDEPGVKGPPCLKRMITEHAGAKTMDRIDGRLVKLPECDPYQCSLSLQGCCFLPKGIEKGISRPLSGKYLPGLHEPTSDSSFELFRSRCGEGDHKDLSYGAPLFQNETHHKGGDGMGLSSTCTCLYQICTPLCAHSLCLHANKGEKIYWDTSVKVSSRGFVSPKQTLKYWSSDSPRR